MEQTPYNNTPAQSQQNYKRHHHHHHHTHRNPSNKKLERRKIYRTIFVISGFVLIFFSITSESLLLAFSGSLLLLVSLAFTDVYKKITRISEEFLSSLNSTIDENKEHSHRRHHRNH